MLQIIFGHRFDINSRPLHDSWNPLGLFIRCSLFQNEFGHRQIARVSDLEIEIVIRDEDDFSAEKLDC